jgi:protein tyrosine/serine phosphatase
MAGKTKRVRHSLRHVAGTVGRAILTVLPRSLKERFTPEARYVDMLFFDHLIVRLVFPNRHRLSEEAWRAAQPLPHQIADYARRGIRTVVNLRGQFDTQSYAFEKAACERAGLNLVDFTIKSRDAPSRADISGARELFGRLEYPILMHCKSGADRVGLMSALYLIVRRGATVKEAKSALSLRYGHIRQADTGVLDYFFERYLQDTAQSQMPFFEWVETVYDAAEVKKSFRAKGWANRITDAILHRE